MMDPNFKRSVVLLSEHTRDGTVGYILNQRSDFYLGDLLPDFGGAEWPVFIGGPVGNDTLHFIHRCYDKMNSGSEIGNGIFWGGNFETLQLLLKDKLITSDEVMFFAGYSGWDYGQLDKELEQNSWLVTNTYSPDILFADGEENLWKDIVKGLGPKYAHIANFPENPMWN